ncbi:protein-glutamate methylesterase/protein-glutamine glutaminase [Chromobacterium violaceum]|uniref:protein-glutamate methylesterase/protein-glutamine glutaminase n=1 Tax=Chromobacterium violaceum TaxID=536 RepID=UPI00096D80C5|nr:chemotaxis response regulator protein-glutamate methylesterase [Chromobacterium violaceum]OLZ87383.1 chemotaxis response regulator protein-glutamate methylesterase [Chromobacterium violaceum]STB64763.1 Chemotaxis response regulator protein-glutamate methylesterase [Chromobacterium violaceum]
MSAGTGRRIRVVVVDDSALVRSLLTAIVNEAPDMEVVATASDPIIAREKIRETSPDVVTLDVEMPRMDGLEFLRRLMRLRPTPVLMISSLTDAGSETTLTALELGAVDFIHKPADDIARHMQQYAEEIREKLRVTAEARLRQPNRFRQPPPARKTGPGAPLRKNALVFVGASTGGTEAIKDFLMGMPADGPPILIVQHMPEHFTFTFAERLNKLCPMRVKEAEDGEAALAGVAYIAPGHSHMRVAPAGGGGFRIALDQEAPVNRHRPAVDPLFDSAARHLGQNAIGVILTGMGKDGAEGLLRMRHAGAATFGQDEASCVVYGMPREAFRIGAVAHVLPLSRLAEKVIECLQSQAERAIT